MMIRYKKWQNSNIEGEITCGMRETRGVNVEIDIVNFKCLISLNWLKLGIIGAILLINEIKHRCEALYIMYIDIK